MTLYACKSFLLAHSHKEHMKAYDSAFLHDIFSQRLSEWISLTDEASFEKAVWRFWEENEQYFGRP
jgi:hypothetical protein